MSKGINSMKLNNKSSKVAQVNNVVSVTGNTGTYVNIDVTTHTQYNNDVLNGKAQYLFDTVNNVDLFNAIDETIDFTRFVTIGEEPMICNCITIHDIFNFYSNGCIQQFYNEFCKSHSNEESITLARFLSAIGIEVWRNVECYGGAFSGLYMVSNLGRVLSLNKNKHFGKILKQDYNPCGYMYVHLWHNYQQKTVRVNRLVALTFYGVPTEKLECCHSNTDRLDNRLFNLEFKTQSENMLNPITQRKLKETLKAKADKATESASAPTLE